MNPEVQKQIEQLKGIAENPKKAVNDYIAATGKKAVGCFPIYTPEELVYAAGALPVGMWGGRRTGSLADKYLQSFCCSIMKANTEQSLAGDYDMLSAVIVTTYCDTLKCVTENWKIAVPHLNIIPIVYPQNRKQKSGQIFFAEELQRVKGKLEEVLGADIADADVEAALNVYEEYRKTMQMFTEVIRDYPKTFDAVTRHLVIKAAYYMDKKEYTEIIKAMMAELRKVPAEDASGMKKVILTGLIAEPVEMLELFTENEMYVVADDLAQESRQFRVSAPAEGSCYERMAARLAAQDGCTFLYDYGKTRSQRLFDMKKQYNADAIIFCQLKFCDPDEFDYPIVKKDMETFDIPMLYLEFEQQMESVGQLRTRIQSFAEMMD